MPTRREPPDTDERPINPLCIRYLVNAGKKQHSDPAGRLVRGILNSCHKPADLKSFAGCEAGTAAHQTSRTQGEEHPRIWPKTKPAFELTQPDKGSDMQANHFTLPTDIAETARRDALARLLAAQTMHLVHDPTGAELPEDLWQQKIPVADAVLVLTGRAGWTLLP